MTLTPRQHSVLAYAAAGFTDKEIGHMLGNATSTISVHMGHVLARMGAHSRAHAVALAYEQDILRINGGSTDDST